MLYDKLETNSISLMLDKFAVKELIEYERFCRDNALWEQMAECYSDNSEVTISWYHGDGKGFVKASSEMKLTAPHKLHNTLVWINGSRAAAVCMACVQTRKEIDGILLDLTSYVKLVYTAVKAEDSWIIASLDAIYEKDCLVPTSPPNMKPANGARPSYSNLINVIGYEGYDMNHDLPGDDRPDLRENLLLRVDNWLMSVPRS